MMAVEREKIIYHANDKPTIHTNENNKRAKTSKTQ
jgi:hypothetical protein